MSEINKHLWNIHSMIVERAKEADDLVLFHIGDVVQGTKYLDGCLTSNLHEQIEIAYQNMIEFYRLENLKVARIITGTRSHEDGVGTASKILGMRLRKEFPNVDTRTVEHSLADVDGVLIDVAHHGPSGGRRIWLNGNEARFYLRNIVISEIMAGNRPPDVVMRGHVHTKVTETITVGDNEHRLIVLPSMMMIDSGFARQATRSAYTVTNGGVFFEVQDGAMSAPEFVAETVDIRTKEKL